MIAIAPSSCLSAIKYQVLLLNILLVCSDATCLKLNHYFVLTAAAIKPAAVTFSPDDALFIYEVLILLCNTSFATAHNGPLHVRLAAQNYAYP